MTKVEILWELPKSDKDAEKWENAIGKIAPIELFNSWLPHFNL